MMALDNQSYSQQLLRSAKSALSVRILRAAAVASIGLVAMQSHAQVINLANYLPFDVGSVWMYTCKGESITAIGTGSGVSSTPSSCGTGGTTTYQQTAQGFLLGSFGGCTYSPPIVAFVASGAPGAGASSSGSFSCPAAQVTGTYSATTTLQGVSTTTTGAGKFNTARVSQTLTNTIQGPNGPETVSFYYNQWLGEGIGLVRQTETESTGTVKYDMSLTYTNRMPASESKDDGEPDECGSHAANPINMGTGNSVKSAQDFRSPSLPGLRRIYNSRAPALSTFGYAWRHEFDHRIQFVPVGTRQAVIARADGKVMSFTEPGVVGAAGNWTKEADVDGRLSPTYVAGNTTPTGWKYVNERDEVELYDANGYLTSVTMASGMRLEFAYVVLNATATGRVLSTITDSLGRTLTLNYNTDTLISSAVDADGKTISYGYNAQKVLTAVTFPDTKVRTYRYNEQARTANTAQPYALTSILDENGVEYVSWEFDAEGRAVANQFAGGVDRTTLSFITQAISGTGGSTSGSTTVVDAFGTSRSVAYNKVLGVTKPSTMSSACNHAIKGGDASRSYDTSGNITVRNDFNNNRTCSAYNSQNLETVRVEGYPGATACPANLATYAVPAPTGSVVQRKISSQWHPDWRLTTRVAQPRRITTYVYNGQPDPTASNAITTCAPAGALVDGKPIAVLCKVVAQATTDATGTSGFAATLVTGAGASRTWAYTYDKWGNVLTAKDPLNNTTTNTYYTDTDTCTSNGGTGGTGCRGKVATISNAAGHVTTIGNYDGNSRARRLVDANGLETLLTYNNRGWLTERKIGTTALGYLTTTYAYDFVGQLTQVTLPDGSYLQYTYDAAHRLTQVQDGLGNKTVYTLDAIGNRTKEDTSDPSNTLARTRSRAFNTLNRLQSDIGGTTYAAAPTTATTTYAYDAQGNRTTVTDPLSRVMTSSFDALNRLTTVTDPQTPTNGVTQYEYDGLDHLTKVTDPKNLSTLYTVNSFGEVTSQASPDTGTTSITYDVAGNVTQKIDARGAKSTWVYDNLNRVTTLRHFPNSTTTTAEETITYTYDAAPATGAGSATACAPSGVTARGRLCNLRDSSGDTSYTYDQRGRVIAKVQTIGTGASARVQTTTYSYNAVGQMSGMVTPSGQSVGYTYTNNRITGVTINGAALISNALYEPFGPVASWVWGNTTITPGVTYKEYKDYDLDGRMTIYEFRNGTSILKNTIAWDQASRITTLTDNVASSNNKVFAYDNLDRLTAMSAASGVTTTQPNYSFAYDLLSNRASMGVTPPAQATQNTTYAYGATNHRLNTLTAPVAANNKTYTYDLAGNVLTDGAAATNFTFTYDAKNRMKTVSWTGGSTAVIQTQTYVYNGMGQRVRKVKTAGTGTATATSTIAQPTANYTYDEAGQITGEYNANNQLIQEIIWLNDIPLATLRPRAGQTLQTIPSAAGAGVVTIGQLNGTGTAAPQVIDHFYIHADHLNTPRAITRPSDNKLVWRWDNTEAFGNNTPNENPQAVGAFKFNLRFPGQQFDAETNLHYNYFRDYNPAIGRYVQSDPIGLEGGLNTYGYVVANPLALMDPLGLMTSVEARVMVLLGQGNLAEAIVIAEAAGLAIAPRLAQTQTAMQNLINKFPLQTNQCEKLASGLSDAFKSMQANPQIFRVEPTATRFIRIGVEGSYSPTNHVFVRVGNTIFDASTGAQGVPYTQYITMLNQINQGPGSYVIKRFKVK